MAGVSRLEGMPERDFNFPVGVDLPQFLESALVVLVDVGFEGVVSRGHVQLHLLQSPNVLVGFLCGSLGQFVQIFEEAPTVAHQLLVRKGTLRLRNAHFRVWLDVKRVKEELGKKVPVVEFTSKAAPVVTVALPTTIVEVAANAPVNVLLPANV